MRKWIVTGLGTGYLPVAPGTWGSAAVAGIFLVVALATRRSVAWTNVAMVAVLVFSSMGCLALGRFAEQAFGRKDPRQCSLDEWAGQALSCLLLPLGGGAGRLAIVAASAFAAFRAFDIIKAPPARASEKLPAGAGILLDDLIAAVYANLVCQLIFRAWLKW